MLKTVRAASGGRIKFLSNPTWGNVGFATLVLCIAQITPFVSVIVSLFWGALWISLGIQATVLLFAWDCFRGELPRRLLAIPIAFHAIGPSLFLVSGIQALSLNAELERSRTPPAQFDPARMSVMLAPYGEHTAESLIAGYDIARVYVEPGPVLPYRAFNFATNCSFRSDEEQYLRFGNRPVENACARVERRAPNARVITFEFEQPEERGGFIEATIYRAHARLSGGERRTAAAAHLRIFAPVSFPIVGCWLEGGGYIDTECRASFPAFETQLGTRSRITPDTFAALIAQMLGLRERVHHVRDHTVIVELPRP